MRDIILGHYDLNYKTQTHCFFLVLRRSVRSRAPVRYSVDEGSQLDEEEGPLLVHNADNKDSDWVKEKEVDEVNINSHKQALSSHDIIIYGFLKRVSGSILLLEKPKLLYIPPPYMI